MEIKVRDAGGKYTEVTFTDGNTQINVGILDDEGSRDLARDLISAAEDLLSNTDFAWELIKIRESI